MKKYFALLVLLLLAGSFMACGDEPANVASSNNSPEVLENPNDTPTDAYKRLFAAVKNKDTAAIKQEFSQNSVAAAEAQAARMNIPVEEVYKNGFTRTTFADRLPETRDERVNGKMGALEVWNAGEKMWEDLPFIREQSGWKLAVGDVFAGNWKRPGKGRAQRESEAANALSPNRNLINGMTNTNMNGRFPGQPPR